MIEHSTRNGWVGDARFRQAYDAGAINVGRRIARAHQLAGACHRVEHTLLATRLRRWLRPRTSAGFARPWSLAVPAGITLLPLAIDWWSNLTES
jgi:hypothetical protein